MNNEDKELEIFLKELKQITNLYDLVDMWLYERTGKNTFDILSDEMAEQLEAIDKKIHSTIG